MQRTGARKEWSCLSTFLSQGKSYRTNSIDGYWANIWQEDLLLSLENMMIRNRFQLFLSFSSTGQQSCQEMKIRRLWHTHNPSTCIIFWQVTAFLCFKCRPTCEEKSSHMKYCIPLKNQIKQMSISVTFFRKLFKIPLNIRSHRLP